MTTTRSASSVLDHDFLEIRHRILDIAAALDRIDRAPSSDDAIDDPRRAQIRAALVILSEIEAGRAQRVQMAFSRLRIAD